MDRELVSYPFYHGLLPREDIKSFLRKPGDFLLRISEPAEPGKRECVLSVLVDKQQPVRHFIVSMQSDGQVSVETTKFGSIGLLVEHHLTTKNSLTSKANIVINTPILRRHWELEHDDIKPTKKIGAGAFGEVHLGELFVRKTGKKVPVAIKMAKLDAMTKDQIKDIMREARLMRYFDHPNVVRLYGVAALSEPLMLVMELADQGSLDSYLKKNAVSIGVKQEMIVQASWAIEFLHKKNCLHRDIAARNCLYGDNKVKISDFGLSRPGNVYQMNPKNKVPIRWLAPETIKSAIYTQKTDVFSYGILCWEIFHNGIEPYPKMKVADVVSKVKSGYRMSLEDCEMHPDIVKLIQENVWAPNPNDRFPMSEVSKRLEDITHIRRPQPDKPAGTPINSSNRAGEH